MQGCLPSGLSLRQQAAEAPGGGAEPDGTIGNGSDVVTDLGGTAEDGTEPEEAASGQESSATVAGLTIIPAKVELGQDENKLYLDLENTTDEDLYVEWRRVLFAFEEEKDRSGVSSTPGEETCYIKAHDVHQEVFTVLVTKAYTPYAKTTVMMTVMNADKSLSEKMEITLPIGKNDVETVEMSEPKANSVYFEEQEFYNDGTLLFTLPEQTVEPVYYTERDNPHYEVKIHYENNSDDTSIWYNYAFLDAKINGVAPQPDALSWGDFLSDHYLQLISGQNSDKRVEIDNDFQVPFNTGEDSGEITFTLSLKVKDTDEVLSETPVTIHYTVVK